MYYYLVHPIWVSSNSNYQHLKLPLFIKVTSYYIKSKQLLLITTLSFNITLIPAVKIQTYVNQDCHSIHYNTYGCTVYTILLTNHTLSECLCININIYTNIMLFSTVHVSHRKNPVAYAHIHAPLVTDYARRW